MSIKSIKNVVDSVFSVLFTLFMLIIVFYVLMNWPSVWKKVGMGVPTYDTVDSFQVDQVRAASKYDGIDNGMVYDVNKFSDIFVNNEIKKIYRENINKYSNSTLVIPVLSIETPIKYIENMDEDVLNSKLKEGVVHYPGTAEVGEKGNAFIFGHSSFYWWDWSEYTSIFANLESIKKDDIILVYENNELYIYQVSNTYVVDPTDLSVLNQGSDYKLTLMTCTPLGTNLKRFIVEAKLMN